MSNRLRPGGRRAPTIRDIARDAGVSTATVSRVLNHRAEVAPRTRERVLRIVRESGFMTNRTARALSAGRTGLVGVTLPMIQTSYFSTLAAGVAEALYAHDLHPVICPTAHEAGRELGLVERLMHGTTEGAVMVLPAESSAELQALLDRGYAFVVLDPKTPPPPGIPSVSAANAGGAAAATAHLIGLGHRRIGVVTGPAGWCATEERLDGYRSALVRAGVPLDPALEVEADFEVAGGHGAAAWLLRQDDPPTAIFGFNDNLAVGALAAARERRLAVPRDLSVIGFDDSEWAALVSPALTTVRQPLAQMAWMAVELLRRLLEQGEVESLRVELDTRLVVRGSTGAARV